MSPQPAAQTVQTVRATAAEIHGRDPFVTSPAGATGAHRASEQWVVCELTRPAIVVGSRQHTDMVDAASAAAAGFDVARRRSGGGAVVLGRGDHIWIDTVAEAGVLPDDVRASMVAVGRRWVAALERLVAAPRSSPVSAAPQEGQADEGRADDGRSDDRHPDASHGDVLTVHDGGVVSTPWSEQVCFAGVGPGEVLLDGHKLVGLSQRRTRAGAWIQATVYRSRQPHDVGAILRPVVAWSELPAIATLADLGLADLTSLELASALAAVPSEFSPN